MTEPNETPKLERWLPVVLLLMAVGVGLILYAKGGSASGNLTILTGYVALIMVFGIGLLILGQIAIGKIDLSKLLAESNGQASMSRLQLLIFTFVIGLSLIMMVVSATPPKFPAIPNEVLILLGISASTYAVSKGIQKSAESDQTPPDDTTANSAADAAKKKSAAAGGGAEG
jgi:hypothetical protein